MDATTDKLFRKYPHIAVDAILKAYEFCPILSYKKSRDDDDGFLDPNDYYIDITTSEGVVEQRQFTKKYKLFNASLFDHAYSKEVFFEFIDKLMDAPQSASLMNWLRIEYLNPKGITISMRMADRLMKNGVAPSEEFRKCHVTKKSVVQKDVSEESGESEASKVTKRLIIRRSPNKKKD